MNPTGNFTEPEPHWTIKLTHWLNDHIEALFNKITQILDQTAIEIATHPTWTNPNGTRNWAAQLAQQNHHNTHHDTTLQALQQHLTEQGYEATERYPNHHYPYWSLQITHHHTHPEIKTTILHNQNEATLHAHHHTASTTWETTYDLNHPKSLHWLEQDLQHQFAHTNQIT